MLSDAYWYKTKDSAIKCIQITDPHLFSHVGGELLGINTQDTFSQVLKEIQQSSFSYEFILATGDLVQDRAKESYARFCQQIKALQKPVFWTTGNHDYLPDMYEVLGQYAGDIYPHKHILLGDKWQILLLDSQVYGFPYGELSQGQLNWLATKLEQFPQRYSLIILHHHILSTNSAWLDQHNLRNAQEFADVLVPFKQVKGILYGHIHQEVDRQWQGYQVMATPSTCIQFKPDSNNFALDTLQPGWREITLHADGRIETQVKRIQEKQFLPDLLGEGY